MSEVSGLTIYPVTGCAGLELQSSLIAPAGLVGDRTYVLYDPDTRERISQKQRPKLAQLKPHFYGPDLVLTHETADDIVIPPIDETTARNVQISEFGDKTPCYDLDDDVAERFSEFLNTSVRLAIKSYAWQNGDHIQAAARQNAPVHVVVDESVTALRSNDPSMNFGADRFRPSIRLSGFEAFSENDWPGMVLRAGYASIQIQRRTPRCSVPGHSQQDGTNLKDVPKLYRHLAKERIDGTGKPSFGVYGFPLLPANARRSVISVGDEVELV